MKTRLEPVVFNKIADGEAVISASDLVDLYLEKWEEESWVDPIQHLQSMETFVIREGDENVGLIGVEQIERSVMRLDTFIVTEEK